MRQFSNEDLTAFLDEEADVDLERDIQTALHTDGALSQRLADLHLDKEELVGAFDELLAEAPEPADFNPVSPPNTAMSFGLLKTAAAVVLALGVGWFLGQSSDSDLEEWQDYAAAYHKLYVEETLASTSFSDDELRLQLSAALDAIDSDLSFEDIRSINGLELKRSQVLGFSDGKIAHIAMSDANGNPVALCITNVKGKANNGFQKDLGMQTARWSTDEHSFYLIGGADAELIQSVTSQLSDLG